MKECQKEKMRDDVCCLPVACALSALFSTAREALGCVMLDGTGEVLKQFREAKVA